MCCVYPWPLLQQPVRSGAEGDVIRPHEGITRSGELDQEPYDWPEPAARFTFQRVD
jgi:hypothetical protein